MGDIRLVKIAIAAAVTVGLGCGLAGPASAQSLTDRFKSLFGGKPDEPAQDAPAAAPSGPTENQIEDSCPPVAIRAGASTFSVGVPGKQATGSDLRYQATIIKTARDCRL